MPTAVLLHGTGGNDSDNFWFGHLSDVLRARGYEVWWPQLPGGDVPELRATLSFVQEHLPALDGESVIVGHSSACPLILSLLERLPTPIAQAILVAGFYSPLPGNDASSLMLQPDYDWSQVRAAAREIVLINSDDDPWGCTDVQARPVALHLSAPLIVLPGQGHMGSQAYEQPYRTFPILQRLMST